MSVLCDLHFLHSKCIMGLQGQLLQDFQAKVLGNNRLAEKDRIKYQSLPEVQQYTSFISRNLNILTKWVVFCLFF